jgi:hypothetical protein
MELGWSFSVSQKSDSLGGQTATLDSATSPAFLGG